MSCYKILKELRLCSKLCRLPLCEQCENHESHSAECELICSWKFANETNFSKDLFRALTIIRGLFLSESEQKILLNMACHDNKNNKSFEVEKLLEEFEGLVEQTSVVDKLKKISSILNTNSFEVEVIDQDNDENAKLSLRVHITEFT